MSENDLPLVSVVMPVFNHPAYRLRRAVRSILNQTYPHIELIVADGNLTDANLKVVEEFNDSRIAYYKAKGYIACLNLGLEKAAGDFIARMDSDDVSLPQRIEEQVRFLRQNPQIGLCSCQAELFGDIEPRVTKYPADVDFFTYVRVGGIVHPAMMFRRELNVCYEHIKPCEDCLLFRRLLASGCVIKNLDKVLFKNRVNKTSMMERHPKLMARYLAKINLETFGAFPDLKGILGFSALEKRRFTISDFSGFLSFVAAVEKSKAFDGVKAPKTFRPYLDYMISHCGDRRKMWLKLLTSRVFYQTYKPVGRLVRQIFSIRNKRLSDGRKIKIATVLGLEIRLKRYKSS